MRVLIVLALFGVVYLRDVTGEKTSSCDRFGVLLYDELKCKPVTDKKHACPTQYECPEYKLSPEECNFQGGKIALGETVDGDLIASSCNAGCFCTNNTRNADDNNNAGFICAILDCGYFPRDNDNCFPKHELGKCCSSGNICPPLENLPTCKVDGTSYVEGQSFRPKDTCLTCVCAKGFEEGNYDNPEICRRRNCAFELREADKYARNCAPVYYKEDESESLCCPQTWICPDDSDVITPDPTNVNKDLKCKYGEKLLNYKDSFTREVEQYGANRNVTCICDLPPLMTCSAIR